MPADRVQNLDINDPRGARSSHPAAKEQGSLQSFRDAVQIVFTVERSGAWPRGQPDSFDAAQRHREPLHETTTEMFLVSGARVIREGNHRDGVAMAQRSRGRTLRGGRTHRPERGCIPTLGKIDDDVVRKAVLAIIASQLPTQSSRFHANDRIVARIERCIPLKHLRAYDELFQPVAAPGQGLDHDKAKEPLQPLRLPERLAAQNPIQLSCHPLFMRTGNSAFRTHDYSNSIPETFKAFHPPSSEMGFLYPIFCRLSATKADRNPPPQ